MVAIVVRATSSITFLADWRAVASFASACPQVVFDQSYDFPDSLALLHVETGLALKETIPDAPEPEEGIALIEGAPVRAHPHKKPCSPASPPPRLPCLPCRASVPVLHRAAWVADSGGSPQVVLQAVSAASRDELLLALRGLQQHDGTMLVEDL
jgi:hypothetical protein